MSNSKRSVRFAVAFIAAAGCSVLSLGPVSVIAADDSQVQRQVYKGDRSQLMYEIMIAELAGRRGYLDIATEGYRSASARTDDPRVSERATKLAVYSRNWPHAIETGSRWKALDPDNPEIYQILTQVQLRRGNSSAAADEMTRLIELSPNPVDATVEEIYATVAREPDGSTALNAMRELRDRLPQEPSTNIAYARLAVSNSEREAALEAIDQALELQPHNGEALMVRAQILMSLGRGDEGLANLKKAVDDNPTDVNLHLGLARLLVDAGRYDEAESEFDRIYKSANDDAQAMFTIGLLGLESKRNTAAATYFKRLLELGEFESEAHYYLARIADSQQKYEEAIHHYEMVVSGDSFFDAHIRAAELYGLTDRVSEGQARLKELKQAASVDQLPRLVRSEARMLREAGRSEEGLAVLTEGLEQFPNDSNLLYTRALMADGQGNNEMFRTDLEQLIEQEPDHAHALNALGYHYADTNSNLDTAEDLLEKANRLLPQDPAIMDSLGWLYYRQGRMDDALNFLRNAYDELEDPEIAAHLGEVLWVTGEQDSAREIWDKALAESPDDMKLKSVVERFIQ